MGTLHAGTFGKRDSAEGTMKRGDKIYIGSPVRRHALPVVHRVRWGN